MLLSINISTYSFADKLLSPFYVSTFAILVALPLFYFTTVEIDDF